MPSASLADAPAQCPRIATDIRIGTRTDKPAPGAAASEGETQGEEWEKGLGENERKRESVRRRLAQE